MSIEQKTMDEIAVSIFVNLLVFNVILKIAEMICQ
jgi:hypothetical protein